MSSCINASYFYLHDYLCKRKCPASCLHFLATVTVGFFVVVSSEADGKRSANTSARAWLP